MKQNAKSAIFTRENGKRLLRQLLLLLPAWIVLALGIAMSVFSGVGSDTNTSFNNKETTSNTEDVSYTQLLYN